MQEQDVMDQITSRNLEMGGVRTPLREFKGILEKVYKEHDDKYNRDIIHLAFVELEVIHSIEPYDFPIADITISYSRRSKSLWGIFSTSLVKFLKGNEDIMDAVGRVLHMELTTGHMLWDGQAGKEVDRPAWECMGISGDAATKPAQVDALKEALSILDGKTLSQFNAAALSNPNVRTDPKVQSAIMSKTFVKTAIDNGLASVDADGIYHLS